jgi:hypothetical protein
VADVDLQTWRHGATIGDEIAYYRGCVANDRLRVAGVEAVATDAMRLAEKGRVCLCQRKIKDGLYDYLAVAADLKPWPVKV